MEKETKEPTAAVKKIVQAISGRAKRARAETPIFWSFEFIKNIAGRYYSTKEIKDALDILLDKRTVKLYWYFWENEDSNTPHLVSAKEFQKAKKAGVFVCPATGKEVFNFIGRFTVVYAVPPKAKKK